MSISRRGFLRQTVGFSAAAVLSGTAAWPALGKAGSAARSFHDLAYAPVFHLLALGDWGVQKKDLERQRAVSRAMTNYAGHAPFRPDALALLGDNFYNGLGRQGVESPRWDANVESMYPPASFPGPMYAVLGNHDYTDGGPGGSVAAELAYRRRAPQSRWTLPAKWYRFDLSVGGEPLANVVAIDTNFVFPAGLSRDEKKKQDAWIAAELAKRRTAPFLFVLGHHPVYSGGMHGDTSALVDQLDPLLRRHGVDLYLCGHDHDLQHIEFKHHPTSFVVSGAGGARAREVRQRKAGAFAKAIYGFTHVELRRDCFALRHVDANGVVLHAFEKTTAGKLTVLS